MKKRLFQYAVLHHVTTSEEKDSKGCSTVNTEVLVEPKTLLAKNEKEVGMRVARELPDNVMDDLDNVEIIVRPF